MGRQMATRAKMTGWYDPIRLIQIGFRVVSSTVFGSMFDRRELMASLDFPFNNPADFKADFDTHFDLSAAGGDLWFDFCADTGDGWDSTYAVARLLARPNLSVDPPPGRGGAPPVGRRPPARAANFAGGPGPGGRGRTHHAAARRGSRARRR